jgi:hypothetical protein
LGIPFAIKPSDKLGEFNSRCDSVKQYVFSGAVSIDIVFIGGKDLIQAIWANFIRILEKHPGVYAWGVLKSQL